MQHSLDRTLDISSIARVDRGLLSLDLSSLRRRRRQKRLHQTRMLVPCNFIPPQQRAISHLIPQRVNDHLILLLRRQVILTPSYDRTTSHAGDFLGGQVGGHAAGLAHGQGGVDLCGAFLGGVGLGLFFGGHGGFGAGLALGGDLAA